MVQGIGECPVCPRIIVPALSSPHYPCPRIIPALSWVLKVDCQVKLDIQGKKWKINRALAGEWVQVVRVEQRMMLFYCTTLIRELGVGTQRSMIFERWVPGSSPSSEM